MKHVMSIHCKHHCHPMMFTTNYRLITSRATPTSTPSSAYGNDAFEEEQGNVGSKLNDLETEDELEDEDDEVGQVSDPASADEEERKDGSGSEDENAGLDR